MSSFWTLTETLVLVLATRVRAPYQTLTWHPC